MGLIKHKHIKRKQKTEVHLFTVLAELLASPWDQLTPLRVPQLIRTASVGNLTTFLLQLVRLLGHRLMCACVRTARQSLRCWSAKCSRVRLKCDGTRAETKFRLLAKGTSPFKSAEASVQSTTGSRGVRISDSNAGYTKFLGSVKGTGYLLHSPASSSLPLPCVTVCQHVSTGLYLRYVTRCSLVTFCCAICPWKHRCVDNAIFCNVTPCALVQRY